MPPMPRGARFGAPEVAPEGDARGVCSSKELRWVGDDGDG